MITTWTPGFKRFDCRRPDVAFPFWHDDLGSSSALGSFVIRVNIIHGPWRETNTRAFFSPVLRCRTELRDNGILVRFFPALTDASTDGDFVLLDDKYFGAAWSANVAEIVRQIEAARCRTASLIYCDLGDSSGLIRVQALLQCDAYWKAFLLRDRSQYTAPHYGGRLFTDHYHRAEGVQDEPELWSQAVPEDQLAKLHLSWSYGLTSHSLMGNRASHLFSRIPAVDLLDLPLQTAEPGHSRPIPMSCRMSTSHRRASVVHQRLRLKSLLGDRIPTSRVSPRAFFAELRQSRLVLSPFGWGEFAYRDYEAFVSGAALVKPSMAHLETFPDYYRDNETMLPLRWDLADLESTLSHALERPAETQEIARTAQNVYKYHVAAPEGRRDFAERFRSLLLKSKSVAAQPPTAP